MGELHFDLVRRRADGSLWVHYNLGSGPIENTQLMASTVFKRDTWYILQIILDDNNGFLLRAWERDNPLAAVSFRQNMNASGQSWRFAAQAQNGTVWMDTYSEGAL